MPRVDATRIIPGLYVGSAPDRPQGYERFDVIYFCADDWQPPSAVFPKNIVRRYPFDDAMPPDDADLQTALQAGEHAARDLLRDRKTLITCVMGRNRSALVAGIALHYLTGMPGVHCVERVRSRRRDPTGMRALANLHFRQFLATLR